MPKIIINTSGDSDVISMPAGFRRHLVGKTLTNDFHCDVAENTLCWRASDHTDIFVNRRKKVKFSHTRYRALGPELIPVYRQSARR